MSKKKSEKEEKTKKTVGKKASAKSKKTESAKAEPALARPDKKKGGAGKSKPAELSSEAIALRAYFIAERRQKMGWPGDSTSDWVEAERQLKAERAKKK